MFEDDEEEQEYVPRSLEQCMEDAYHFDKNFHKRGIPPFPQEHRGESTPTRQAVLTKRHQSRVKRAQHPVHVQKDIQRNILLRRSQRAAERGDVSVRFHNLPPMATTLRAVGHKDYCKGNVEWPVFSKRLIWWFCVINLTRATAWESSARELARGCYSSSQGWVVFPNATSPRRIINSTPLHRFFFNSTPDFWLTQPPFAGLRLRRLWICTVCCINPITRTGLLVRTPQSRTPHVRRVAGSWRR